MLVNREDLEEVVSAVCSAQVERCKQSKNTVTPFTRILYVNSGRLYSVPKSHPSQVSVERDDS
jgi:hypothetical protein